MNIPSVVETKPLLKVEHLSTKIKTPDGILTVVEDVDLTIEKGEIMVIVGESGSGKSMTISSILQLLPKHLLHSYSGKIEIEGENLLTIGDKKMQEMRGGKISLVAQNAMTSLDPSYRVGKQIVEIMLNKTDLSKKQAAAKALSLLEQMGIDEPERIFQSYPHQLSGGLRQRVVIAMSLACSPDLIIADEPTSALDPTVQLQVLDLFQKINQKFGTAILIITHDFGVVARIAGKVAVMYAGQIVEKGTTKNVIFNPKHPYTQSLLKCIPSLDWIFDEGEGKKPLWQIKGELPNLLHLPQGCRFADRCHVAKDSCRTKKPLLKKVKPLKLDHSVRCLLTEGGN
ncbi:ABC transporter ATP-binding protein [Bacillus benzoevorans]|uniref:Oligopeptide/dipeptide ABC transporter ATP-binding protein n=1 Tax=Bacillus benzoevorans TaxID=1456 RepID=A0A7X0HV08_9BACI|nr:ABC transporter ATP-binding protein [Bacillus benzoevorans]MBB6446180.1 oligopeptide/dipeptide ABC transporter ATP-binding protein [Bacillus benzoevorans]